MCSANARSNCAVEALTRTGSALIWAAKLAASGATNKLLADVVAHQQRRASRDPAFGLIQRAEPAFRGARRLGDVHEGRFSTHGQQLGSGEKSRAAMEVVTGVVITQHQSMPQQQIEQRLRALVVGEAGLLAQRIERLAGCIDQPLDVVAIVGRVSANGIASRTVRDRR